MFAATAPAAPRNGLIAFHTESGPDGAGQGYVAVEPDGNFRARMSTSPAVQGERGTDVGGEWSADGRRFVGARVTELESADGTHPTVDLYVMNADGSGFKWLTRTEAYEEDPRWSSDGRWLVFSVEEDGERVDIMRSNGRARRTLLDTPDDVLQPDWSPDGRRIVFRRLSGDRSGDLWTVRRDGTDLRQVTDTPGAEISPQWSPDGDQIVYSLFTVEEVLGGLGTRLSEDIWLRRPDGSEPRQLTTDAAQDELPAWSPDGASIVFVSDREPSDAPGDTELYTIAWDGTGETMLIDLEGRDYWPSWAPAVPAAPIVKRRVAVRRGRARMLVSCFGLAERDCDGMATLSRRGRILARGRFRIRKGARKVVKLPLTPVGRELMQSRARPTPAKATVRVQGERARRTVVMRRG